MFPVCFRLRIFTPLILSAMVLMTPLSASAVTVVSETSMDFGTFVVKNNNSVAAFNLTKTSSYTADPEFIVVSDPTAGSMDLSGFPTNTSISITFDPTTLSGAGGVFSISNFDVTSPRDSGAGGLISFTYGARLSTSGTGTPYSDGSYSGTLNVIVSY